MNSGFRFLIGFNGYPFSALLAMLFHALALAFILYWNGVSSSSEFELIQPTVIKALFIDENPQLRERQRLEQQRVVRQREQEQQRQQEDEQQRQQEERRQQEDERLRQQEDERLRQQQLEQQRQEELLQQAELERLAEEQRRRDELAQQERRVQEQEAERRRAQDSVAAAAAARTEFEVVQSGVALIQQVVEENWSRPPSARNGMRAVLRISMLPTGEVTDVVIIESSDDPAFDRSAETAVFRAAPFRELEVMPINIFNENFRSLSLIFEPEDLLN